MRALICGTAVQGRRSRGTENRKPSGVNGMNLDGSRLTVASPDQGMAAAKVSREIVQLNAKLFGRGPVRARTFLQDAFALCLLESILTTAEKTLIAAGRADEVQS